VGLALLLALTGEFLIHHYDPTRILYKRLKAPDRYLYEEIDPAFLAVAPRDQIAVRDRAALEATRARVRQAVWGRFGYPTDRLPVAVEPEGPGSPRPAMRSVARMEVLTVAVDRFHTRSYLLRSATPANRLVLYQNGFASDVWSVADRLDALAARGFDVLAINLAGYGETPRTVERDGEQLDLHLYMARLDTPLRYHFETPVVALNHALRQVPYRSVDIIGFSAGGFLALATAAVEPRIRRTVTVAGAYPLYLQTPRDALPTGAQAFPSLVEAAAPLDLFVLAAAGAGRGVTQIFNRYDRCCYNNRKGKLYEVAVAEAVQATGAGGAFAVWIDETHADHKISDAAIDLILRRLEAAE